MAMDITNSSVAMAMAPFDWQGTELGRIDCEGVALISKVLDRPGEQILAYREDGTVSLYNTSAVDSDRARTRYAHPYYRIAQRLTASGYNLPLLGGI